MLDESFNRVYTKFKLHFYRAVFSRFQTREASLTTVETFCMEIINALGHPTIAEFSSFVNISPPIGSGSDRGGGRPVSAREQGQAGHFRRREERPLQAAGSPRRRVGAQLRTSGTARPHRVR